MVTWQELRTVALVGLDRRPLPESAGDAGSAQEMGTPRSSPQLSPERRALQLAAMLGTARRAGARTTQTEPTGHATPTAPRASTVTAERTAPPAAVQLLDLLLSGSVGSGSETVAAVRRWFERCAEAGCVVPHHLLVRTLDHGTGQRDQRSIIGACLGSRGRWLAEQRSTWQWVTKTAVDSQGALGVVAADTASIDLEGLLAMESSLRVARLRSARDADADTGRRLISEVLGELNAADRSETLQCLEVGLSAADDELVEAALDDRSKLVRGVAVDLANSLPTPSRARRFTRRLESATEVSGRMRRTITVAADPPEDDDARDLPPDFAQIAPGSSLADRWVSVMAAGTPLDWWTENLDLAPSKIVAAAREPRDHLLRGWSVAAIAQRNREWAEALFEASPQLALVPLVDSASVLRYVERAPVGDKARMHEARLREMVRAISGPWTADTSAAILAWTRRPKSEPEQAARLSDLAAVIGERSHADLTEELQRRLARAKADKAAPLARPLQSVLRQISLRSSIDEAFS